jgi:hypothetical protein
MANTGGGVNTIRKADGGRMIKASPAQIRATVELQQKQHPVIYHWPAPDLDRLQQALRPGSRIARLFAFSIHIEHADGTMEIVDRQTPFPESAPQIFEGGRPPWSDNGPRREDGSRYAVESMKREKA